MEVSGLSLGLDRDFTIPPLQVVNARAALLSNYEVLDLLRELESEHLQRTKTAHRIKKEEDSAGTFSIAAAAEDVCENLRTVEVEVRRVSSITRIISTDIL
jgi:hypothetical protein